jgi:RHS repeat-associated protein
LYDGITPVQELAGGAPLANLLRGSAEDEQFQRTDSSGAASFLTDSLGSTVALTGAGGTTLAQYTYDSFGNTTATGSSSNSYQYAGRENDGTGLYFYRTRFYSPLFGRFISQDPIGFGGGVNIYAYAKSNPVSFKDPLGTDPNLEKSLNQCAAELAQNYYNSLNPLPDNAVAKAVYSNTFSDLSNLVTGGGEGRVEAGEGLAASEVAREGPHLAAEGAENGVRALSNSAVDGGATRVLSSTGVGWPIDRATPDITFATRPLQVSDTALGGALKTIGKGLGKTAEVLGSVADGKLLIDAGVYLGAEAVCAFY